MAHTSPSGITADQLAALAEPPKSSVTLLLNMAANQRAIASGEMPLLHLTSAARTAARAAALAQAQAYEHSARQLAGLPDPA